MGQTICIVKIPCLSNAGMNIVSESAQNALEGQDMKRRTKTARFFTSTVDSWHVGHVGIHWPLQFIIAKHCWSQNHTLTKTILFVHEQNTSDCNNQKQKHIKTTYLHWDMSSKISTSVLQTILLSSFFTSLLSFLTSILTPILPPSLATERACSGI